MAQKKHTQGIKIDPTFIEVDGKVKEKHFCTEKTDEHKINKPSVIKQIFNQP